LKPDIVAIQEFNYVSTNGLEVNTPAAFREMVDLAFGTNFVYYREPFTGTGDIPNGIISRYRITASGSWPDTVQTQPNRGFAWARIAVPGTNDLYIVSVHFLTSSASNRAAEAANLKALMQSSFPVNAWVGVAGDFNTDSRTEGAVTTFSGYLSDNPIPVDDLGNSDTSVNRNSPHDYVLAGITFTNLETATVFPTHVYPSGLVFDSRVYTNLGDFTPVQPDDSGLAQHMAVVKDFLLTTDTNAAALPYITSQPQSLNVLEGSNATFLVTAGSVSALTYQWRFNGTNIDGAEASACSVTNVQPADSGIYSVAVSNSFGGLISSNALLTVITTPLITTNPASLTLNQGENATFKVGAVGPPPLTYQWLFNGTNTVSADTNSYTLTNAQPTDAGSYSVIVGNNSGSVTSSPAVLTVLLPGETRVIAQWNFNSVPPDADTSSGTTAASTGSGIAALVGGATSTFATGDTNFDPAGGTDNSAWNTTGYPASTFDNKTTGVQFTVSTAGKQNMVISWSQRSSNTGSKYFRLQYSTNGFDFVDFPAALTCGTSFTSFTNNLAAMPGVNDNASFAFRIVAEFESTAAGTGGAAYVAANTGSSYASTGTTRFDMVTVTGSTNSSPESASLSDATFLPPNSFQFSLNGSVGSQYVVQVSTNLSEPKWTTIYTNTAPFNFTATNASGPRQQFYRAVSPP
jgi:Immunoglobulin domain